MFLADNLTDSLLIYTDWLEDNDQLTLATEIREELQEMIINTYCHQYIVQEGVGVECGSSGNTWGTDYTFSNIGVYSYCFSGVGIRESGSLPTGVGRTGCRTGCMVERSDVGD